MENKYQLYKGIWYRYSPNKHDQGMDVWELSEKEDESGFKMLCNSDTLRIDECLNLYQKEYERGLIERNFNRLFYG